MTVDQDFTSVLETDDNRSTTNSPDKIIISRFMCYEIVCHVNLFSNRITCFAFFLPLKLACYRNFWSHFTFPHVRTANGPAGIIDIRVVHCVCSFHLLFRPCSSFWHTPAFCQHLAKCESCPLSRNCQKSAAWIASAASSWILVLFWAVKLLMGLNEQYTLQYGFRKSSFLNWRPCFGSHICFAFQNVCFHRKHN